MTLDNIDYIKILLLSLIFVAAYADQVSPHMRCDISEKMTWSEELNQHECETTSFIGPPAPTCTKDVDYVWEQTGPQSYEQVKCNIPVTQINPSIFDTIEDWDYWAWKFVFTEFYGF